MPGETVKNTEKYLCQPLETRADLVYNKKNILFKFFV